MSRRISKRYTILIACTGREPITFTFEPLLVVLLLVISISLPTCWVVKIVNSYIQKNTQLAQRNDRLTQEATGILQRVTALETEIDTLQKRAGLSEVNATSEEGRSSHSQGGIGTPVEAEMLLAIAKSKLPNLLTDLQAQVRPALEKTLNREAARPTGIPLKGNIEVSSGFGLRQNPFGRNYEFHEGLDFKGAFGSPIYVTAPGVVVKAEFSGGYGYHVIVDHGYGLQTLYAHMSRMAVTPGTFLERDAIVGYLGNTGRSSGPHVHYGVYQNGTPVDPKYYLD